jgi:hypothetical protein
LKLFSRKYIMRRLNIGVCLLAALLFFLVMVSGCSTMRSLISPIVPQRPVLKKRVMVFPLVDQAGLGANKARKLDEDFWEFLKKSPDLMLYKPPDGLFSSMAMTSPLFGVATSSRLIDIAEGLGMNSLIIVVMNPIEIMTRATGIWPFTGYKRFYQISMGLNVVDIVTKTFSMTRIESEEFPVSLDHAEEQGDKKITDQAFREVLPEILEGQAAAVENELAKVPWKGRITAVEDDAVMINAGEKVGVRPGQFFEVLSEGKSIPSGSGRSIRLLGTKIGEIKVDSVMVKHSIAVPVKGKNFSKGQVVRFKR